MASIVHQSLPIGPALTVAPSIVERQGSRLIPEVLVLIVASLLCFVLYAVGAYSLVAVTVPVIILTVTAVANYLMVVRDPVMLLTPLFGARLTAMVVFGAGGLFDAFAPFDARVHLDALYVASAAETAKVNMLWIVGMTTLIAGIAIPLRFRRSSATAGDNNSSLRVMPIATGLWVFAIGFAVSIGNLALATFVGGNILPNSILSLFLAFELCGLFIIAQNIDRSFSAKIVLALGIFVLFVAGVIFQNKSIVLYPTLFAALGALSSRFDWRRALLGAMAVIMLYTLVTPVVSYGRYRQSLDYGELNGGSIGERLGYVADYLDGERIPYDSGDYASWMRIDYIAPASFVVSRFDQGQPDQTLATSPYMFIPRAIWRDKPITTGASQELNYLLGFQGVNQLGSTVFADLYWNVGWSGEILILLLGMYFGAVTMSCISGLRSGDWLFIPFALNSLRIGLGLDGDFTTGMLLGGTLNIILLLLLRGVRKVLPPRLALS